MQKKEVVAAYASVQIAPKTLAVIAIPAGVRGHTVHGDQRLEPRLNELLTFTFEIGRYVSAHSAWRARRLHDRPSMSFEGDIRIDKAIARLLFSSLPDWLDHAPVVRCTAATDAAG